MVVFKLSSSVSSSEEIGASLGLVLSPPKRKVGDRGEREFCCADLVDEGSKGSSSVLCCGEFWSDGGDDEESVASLSLGPS